MENIQRNLVSSYNIKRVVFLFKNHAENEALRLVTALNFVL